MGVNRILRVDFDLAGGEGTYASKALEAVGGRLHSFGVSCQHLVARLGSSSITRRISPSGIRWTARLRNASTWRIGSAMPICCSMGSQFQQGSADRGGVGLKPIFVADGGALDLFAIGGRSRLQRLARSLGRLLGALGYGSDARVPLDPKSAVGRSGGFGGRRGCRDSRASYLTGAWCGKFARTGCRHGSSGTGSEIPNLGFTPSARLGGVSPVPSP
jgi:hypothetical protein